MCLYALLLMAVPVMGQINLANIAPCTNSNTCNLICNPSFVGATNASCIDPATNPPTGVIGTPDLCLPGWGALHGQPAYANWPFIQPPPAGDNCLLVDGTDGAVTTVDLLSNKRYLLAFLLANHFNTYASGPNAGQPVGYSPLYGFRVGLTTNDAINCATNYGMLEPGLATTTYDIGEPFDCPNSIPLFQDVFTLTNPQVSWNTYERVITCFQPNQAYNRLYFSAA